MSKNHPKRCLVCHDQFARSNCRNKHEQNVHSYFRPLRPKGRPRRGERSPTRVDPTRFHFNGPPKRSSPKTDKQMKLEMLEKANKRRFLTAPAILPIAQRDSDSEVVILDSKRVQTLEPKAANVDLPPMNPVVVLNQLQNQPTFLYYDIDKTRSQFGQLPVRMFLTKSKCKILVLRAKNSDFNEMPELTSPFYSSNIVRHELPRSENRMSVVVCFTKPEAIELAERLKNEMNSILTFVELISDIVPSLQLDSALVIASDADRQSVAKFDLESRGVFVA